MISHYHINRQGKQVYGDYPEYGDYPDDSLWWDNDDTELDAGDFDWDNIDEESQQDLLDSIEDGLESDVLNHLKTMNKSDDLETYLQNSMESTIG